MPKKLRAPLKSQRHTLAGLTHSSRRLEWRDGWESAGKTRASRQLARSLLERVVRRDRDFQLRLSSEAEPPRFLLAFLLLLLFCFSEKRRSCFRDLVSVSLMRASRIALCDDHSNVFVVVCTSSVSRKVLERARECFDVVFQADNRQKVLLFTNMQVDNYCQ